MESKKFIQIYTSILTLICVIGIYDVYNIYNENKQISNKYELILSNQETILSQQESFRMYYETEIRGEYSNRTSVTGLYYRDYDYYCVWTKDRKLSEIQVTDYHESCHALIDSEQRTHFCGEAQ